MVMLFLVMHLVACDHRLLSDEAADDVEGENVTGVMDGEGRKKGGARSCEGRGKRALPLPDSSGNFVRISLLLRCQKADNPFHSMFSESLWQ